MTERSAQIERNTGETQIKLDFTVDGEGNQNSNRCPVYNTYA